ncbi:MAG: hypothetical protein ACTS5I_04625 [Rhodanobacter sp.]
MTTTTINGLANTMVSPASNDLLDIWNVAAGRLEKITRANLVGATITGGGTIATGGFTLTIPATGTVALKVIDNAFSVAQTINGFQIGGTTNPSLSEIAQGHSHAGLRTMSLAHDGTYTVSNSTLCVLLVYDTTNGTAGIFLLRGGYNLAVLLASNAGMSITVNTASSVNVYHDGTAYRVQNKTGGTISLFIQTFGA